VDASDYATKTYRYLRLAMVTMLTMLAAALLIEHHNTQSSCWQTSISAYYYTPVQAILVSTLVAVGVCMLALRGSTDSEDVLLNVGGMLAPVVALVPSRGVGGCRSVQVTLHETSTDIANNMSALFIAGAIGLLIAVALAARMWRTVGLLPWLGIGIAALLTLLGFGWFEWDRSGFKTGAHYTAAVALFVCIILVVLLNAMGYHQGMSSGRWQRRITNPYSVIGVLMVLSVAGMGLWTWLVGWDHGVLWIEGTLIALFALFWIIQTVELWGKGVRQDLAAGRHT
jgi:hypothetical protein